MPTAIPVLVENTQVGNVGSAALKVSVQAVAAVMPVIEPLLSVEPAATVPEPQVDATGAVPYQPRWPATVRDELPTGAVVPIPTAPEGMTALPATGS